MVSERSRIAVKNDERAMKSFLQFLKRIGLLLLLTIVFLRFYCDLRHERVREIMGRREEEAESKQRDKRGKIDDGYAEMFSYGFNSLILRDKKEG